MTDTTTELEAVYSARLMALSGEQRFLMGARMFEAARDMVLASLPTDLGEVETRVALLRRFYSDDVEAETLLEAEKALRRLFRKRSGAIEGKSDFT